MSVHKVVQAGNRVVFEPRGAWIEDTVTGEVMALREQGGVYMLALQTEPGGSREHIAPTPAQGF